MIGYGEKEQSLKAMVCENDPIATRTTVTMKLTQKMDRLVAELAQVEKVINMLEAHPGVQEVLDAVSSIHGII